MNQRDHTFRKAFYHLKQSLNYFEDSIRESPGSLAASVSNKYKGKLDWIFLDFKTNPKFPAYAQDEFAREMENDVMLTDNISQLCLKLNGKQKEAVEGMLESLISGEQITIVLNEKLP